MYFRMFTHMVNSWHCKEIFAQAECFQSTFPNTRVILDCTEVRVLTPSAKVLNSQTNLNYKSHTTFKGLIGITPNGAVSFVSKLFTGNISHKDITKRA